MAETWRVMSQPGFSGYRQMGIDEALFTLADPNAVPVLRFYTWERPTLSLGYFQDYKRVVNDHFCVHNKIDVVRRITGGRSVLHDKEVTYAVVAPLNKGFANQTLQDTYQLIAKALSHALEEFGVTETAISLAANNRAEARLPQCFVSVSQFEHSTRARKIIGSAQKRTRDRFLQHGSILLDFNSELQSGCIKNSDVNIEEKIAPLCRITGQDLSFQDVVAVFSRSFEEVLSIQIVNDELNSEEMDLAQQLEKKYRSREWTEERCR